MFPPGTGPLCGSGFGVGAGGAGDDACEVEGGGEAGAELGGAEGAGASEDVAGVAAGLVDCRPP